MIKDAIAKVAKLKNLSKNEMEESFEEIMSGAAQEAQISAFITALHLKGETVNEITAAARIMRKFAAKIKIKGTTVDTCGTGGSGKNSFNISTASAFVVAGCDIKVVKHGNRSASSQCGSADVLEKLGINLNIMPQQTQECANKTGIGFLFAPLFHGAMKYAMGVRKAIGIRTIFNILGPLSNPANATTQILGVYDVKLTEIMARVLGNLGVKRAFVVHGLDGLDEISISAPTQVSELKRRRVKTYLINPAKFGFKKALLKDIKGADAEGNAKILTSVLNGKAGPRRDIVVLNAAYAIYAALKVKSIKEAIRMAQESIDSYAALEKLEQLKEFTNKFK